MDRLPFVDSKFAHPAPLVAVINVPQPMLHPNHVIMYFDRQSGQALTANPTQK
jgi:hypothetical protein